MTAPLMELTGVGKVFDGPARVVGLADVDLTVRPGEHVAITGPSGAGKSTLLNVLAMLDRPTSGTYRYEGVDVSTLDDAERTALRARHLGLVFQAFHLLGHLSARENVELGGLYIEPSATQRREEALQLLDRVGLGHRAQAPSATMSGGERQRVAIARALMGRRRVLMCDEPTGNLDQPTAHAMLDLLEALHGDGTTLLIVTHDPATADRAQRRLRVLDGRVHEESA